MRSKVKVFKGLSPKIRWSFIAIMAVVLWWNFSSYRRLQIPSANDEMMPSAELQTRFTSIKGSPWRPINGATWCGIVQKVKGVFAGVGF